MNYKISDDVFVNYPCFQSERLYFRGFNADDAHDLYLIRSNDKIMEYMDINKLASADEARALIISINEAYEKKQGISWVIVERETSKVIGYFGFWRMMPEHCRAEIGYALKQQYWGKGYMSETLKRMILFGFNDLKLHSIEANVNPLNNNSIKLLEKNGFKKEAYFKENYLYCGKYLDSIIYSLLETDCSVKI